MKEKNYNYVGIFAGVLLLIILIGASFAYFGLFTTNLENKVEVNIYAKTAGNTSFTANSTKLLLDVPSSTMFKGNIGLAEENTATISVNLTGAEGVLTTCTYDLVFEYDLSSEVYGQSVPVTQSGTNEITLKVSSPNGTNNFANETNFNYDSSWTAKTSSNGAKKTLVKGITIKSTGTSTIQNIDITGKYYNIDANQEALSGKAFTGTIYVENNKCTVGELPGYMTLLANNGGEDAIKAKGNPDFTQETTTNEGMYAMEDDLGTSYYFRGKVDNNWVKFGKYAEDGSTIYRGYYSETDTNRYEDYSTMEECTSASNYNVNCTETKKYRKGDDIYWRIIRINGDGSIRMIYTGIVAPTERTKVRTYSLDIVIGLSAFNSAEGKILSEYVGYMYTIGEQYGLSTNSTIKTYIDNWYKTTTLETDATVRVSVADQVFCNDRNVTSGYWVSLSKGVSSFSRFYYGAYTRNKNSNPSPTLKCTIKEDRFTVNDIENGNGALTYPVGLITADEINLAGESNSYLDIGLVYWSGSPAFAETNHNRIYMDGLVGANSDDSFYVRPVISISKDVHLSGDGTWNNVYTVS